MVMTDQISQTAGNGAIQFGRIRQVDSVSVNTGQWAQGNGILQVKIDRKSVV